MYLPVPAFLLTTLLASSTMGYEVTANDIKINTETRRFVDEYNRERIFHGVNAVYKLSPWLPSNDGFDALNSLSVEDAEILQSWGFNIVRLGVMWPGLEPSKGQYSSQYLDDVNTLVSQLGDRGIYVILDLHQDLWHREYCGEGVPDYLQEDCTTGYPSDTKPFPMPIGNETYPDDENGQPDIDSCLSEAFAIYYMSNEVGAAFQCLYDNRVGSWDAMANYWRMVAKKFSSVENVLGYELINEPWAGDVIEEPMRLLPEYSEKHYLQPLYDYLHKAIREVDDKKIIFFEGLTIDFWPNGFSSGPGGAEYNDRQVLSYHVYCPSDNPSATSVEGCDKLNAKFYDFREQDSIRLGTGMMMTEFGAMQDIKQDMAQLEGTMQLADANAQSWMYWQYKYYNDITTCTPEGESLWFENGTAVEDKLRVLSRTYPLAVAGSTISYEFQPKRSKFTFVFTSLDVIPSTTIAATTEIYYNRELFYPKGMNIQISDEGSFEYQCPASDDNSGLVKLVQTTGGENEITVTITPCVAANTRSCSCPYNE